MTHRTVSPADAKRRLINLIAVLVPPAALVLAVVMLWGRAADWVSLGLLLGMTLLTTLGVTIGFHRLCTHRSFHTPAAVRFLFAAAGSMAVQGPVITWCAEHRRHHLHADTKNDPHSPHMGEHGSWGDGLWATIRGAFHAHVGWLFGPRSRGLGRYSKDLRRDPVLVAVDRQFPLWVLAGLLLPAVIGGAITQSWRGAVLGLLWGGFVRVLVVHHVTWSVNSICHLWGTRPYDSGDESRNNAILGYIGLGEGWHNNHHAFPSSARHGLRWWELDASYWIICALGWVGLARDIRTPKSERITQRRRGARAKGAARVPARGGQRVTPRRR